MYSSSTANDGCPGSVDAVHPAVRRGARVVGGRRRSSAWPTLARVRRPHDSVEPASDCRRVSAAPECPQRVVPSARLQPGHATIGSMRVLVVDDEKRLAALAAGRAGGRGLRRRRRARRHRRAVAGSREHLRRDRARPDAAGHQRLQGLRDAARRAGLDADPDAHRQGRRVGPGGGARHRGRRLPDQAVLVPGAGRPAARRRPARGAGAADRARGRRPAARPGRAAGLARR